MKDQPHQTLLDRCEFRQGPVAEVQEWLFSQLPIRQDVYLPGAHPKEKPVCVIECGDEDRRLVI